MPASAPAKPKRANNRALSTVLRLLRRARSCAIWYQWPVGVEVPRSSDQNGVERVWYSVRSAPSRGPTLATDASSSAYSLEPIGIGGGQRNCAGLVITNGTVRAICGVTGGRKPVGVSRHLPWSWLLNGPSSRGLFQ